MGKGKKKSNTQVLGKALERNRRKEKAATSYSTLHTGSANDHKKMVSVTEASDLAEFMDVALMADRDFVAEKQNMVILENKAINKSGTHVPEERKRAMRKYAEKLMIPRRPPWTTSMTADELDKRERESFLAWRRALARLEEEKDLILTPFEKNLDFWRQLWRVCERSDIVIQIVDGRNPLFFYCPDMFRYVHDIDVAKLKNPWPKQTLLLVNKADLMPEAYRRRWAKYFEATNIPFVFFSALQEMEEEEEERREEADNASESESEGEEEEEVEEEEEEITDPLAVEPEEAPKKTQPFLEDDSLPPSAPPCRDPTHVYKSAELLDKLYHMIQPEHRVDAFGKPRRVAIGMVGYPNVGKSSTINVLCVSKSVAVSRTPGKTKHFQTIPLGHFIELCDCPGLVFPNFAYSKAELIVNGVLPIDQMRGSSTAPMDLVAHRISRRVLEHIYGITLPMPTLDEDPNRPPTGSELASAYAASRSFMTANGTPDESRAARIILKDYVSGRLLYCHLTPGAKRRKDKKLDIMSVKPAAIEEPAAQAGSEEKEEEEEEGANTAGRVFEDEARLDQEEASTAQAELEDTQIKLSGKTVSARRQAKINEQRDFRDVSTQEYLDEQNKKVKAHVKGKHGKKDFSRVQFKHATAPVQEKAQPTNAQVRALQRLMEEMEKGGIKGAEK
eukprot:GCRY01002944.1.p1 GENE.GCRY01002944.1~~GCRY01002944.1.p1  ORF type:complete len:674 (-),score=211.87 GCRY01002944.1:50-2071(-)